MFFDPLVSWIVPVFGYLFDKLIHSLRLFLSSPKNLRIQNRIETQKLVVLLSKIVYFGMKI